MIRNNSRFMHLFLLLAVAVFLASHSRAEPAAPGSADIRQLTDHFVTESLSDAWQFSPEANITTLNTTEHPGFLVFSSAGEGVDIKGTPKEPIRIDAYPLPWEFQMGMAQPEPKGGDEQTNYALGVNLVVTFSDPKDWPADRSQRPPDTRELQLLVVRLGNYGEVYRQGIQQFRYSEFTYGDPSPETYRLIGRGDLATNVLGDWNIPYIWVGYQPPRKGQLGAAAAWSWGKRGGPAEANGLQDIRFRVRAVSPTKMEIGFGYGQNRGWRMREIDLEHVGAITGIWEIGPIFSLDNWIAEDLPQELDIQPTPALDPPNPELDYYVDYLAFFGNGAASFEHMSTDFDIPGVPCDHKWFNEGDGNIETWSNPGYMTVTFSGQQGAWAMCPMIDGLNTPGLGYIEMDKFPPPMEFEIAFIANDDSKPWNLWHSFSLTDKEGVSHSWSPGIQNIPGKGRFYIDQHPTDPWKREENSEINLVFEESLTPELLNHEPLRIMIQIIDTTHIRVGLKGDVSTRWTFSNVLDTLDLFGEIDKFQLPCPVSFVAQKGSRLGNYPHHFKLLIDYVHYRYGFTEN